MQLPVGHAVRDQGGDGVQGVEPASRLVDRLADVVGGETFLESFPVLERPVPLGVGHRARIEPAVDDLRHPPVGAAVVRVHELDLVHRGPVQIDVCERPPAEALELRPRADAHEVAGAVRPHRERRPPEALARERPVHVVLEPVAEASVAYVPGHPVDGPVELHQPVAPGGGADVPGVLGVVDERIAGAPAVRVVVHVGLGPVQPPALAQQLDEHRIGVLEEAAGHRSRFGKEMAVEPDPVQHGEPVFHPQPEIVRPVGGCGVHDPRFPPRWSRSPRSSPDGPRRPLPAPRPGSRTAARNEVPRARFR